MNDRRRLIITLGAGALAAPLGLLAQQQAGTVPRIGVLWHAGSEEEEGVYIAALRRGFRDLGYVEGQNIALENRFAAEKYERFNSLAVELVHLKVDVLVAVTGVAAHAARRATSSIPIVAVAIGDPVALKLVESLAHPGGNITGLSILVSLSAKRLELFKETVPTLSRLAVLVNPANASSSSALEDTQKAAGTLKIAVRPIEVRSPDELEQAFAVIRQNRANGLIVLTDGMLFNERARIGELALRHHLPTMLAFRESVESGGLMSYAPSLASQFHRVAYYVDKILKGTKPADLPFELPTTFELIINKKTATALGITIPQSVLMRADTLIE